MTRALLLSTVAVLALLCGAAQGAPETCQGCTGRVWYVSAKSQGAGQDGKSWATAFRNVQSALNQAQSGDCIWVAKGRYFTTGGSGRHNAFELDRSLRLYGGFAGTEKCFDQRAGLFKQTHLSGEIGLPGPADNAYNVIRVSAPPPPGELLDVVIDGFTISDANNDFATGEGGGILLFLVERALIENCTVRDNRADQGAGIFVAGSGIDVVRTDFIRNRARFDGGGFFSVNVNSTVDPNIGATLHNVVFKDNVAVRHGGAFFTADMPAAHEVLFVNALFQGNSAFAGGAGYLSEPTGGLLGYKNPGIARLVNATVVDGVASGFGSAFAVEENGPLPAQLVLENSILWGNTGTPTAIWATPFFFSFVSYTLLEMGSPWACTPGPGCTVVPGCDSFACNPLFGAAYHPLASSPAVDSGWPLIPNDLVDLDRDGDVFEPIPLDLDDLPRQVGSIDRGCYERQGP